jgi:hypothetical protein
VDTKLEEASKDFIKREQPPWQAGKGEVLEAAQRVLKKVW